MGDWDVEGQIRELHRIAGLLDHAPASAIELATALFGDDGIRHVDGWRLRGDAALVPRPTVRKGRPGYRRRFRGGRTLIEVRRGLGKNLALYQWAIAHELGEWILRRTGYFRSDIEQYANAIAAGIIAPRSYFLTLVEQYGHDFRQIAAYFTTSQKLVSLRLGEVTTQPVVLVTPARVWYRGDPWFPEDESLLRDIAAEAEPKSPMQKVVLSDVRQHIVLLGPTTFSRSWGHAGE